MRRFLIAPHGGVVIILTAAEARAESSSRPAEHEAPWGRDEIFAVARQMARQLRDGLRRAARYLRALGVELEEALQVLFPFPAVVQ